MFHFESCSQCYPQIIHFNRVFHCKPSILGYPYFWKHPNNRNFGHQKQLNPRNSSTHFVASSTAIPVGGSYRPPSNATTHNPSPQKYSRVPYEQPIMESLKISPVTVPSKRLTQRSKFEFLEKHQMARIRFAQNASKLGFTCWLLGKSSQTIFSQCGGEKWWFITFKSKSKYGKVFQAVITEFYWVSSHYMAPTQTSYMMKEIPQNYHPFALWSPPKMGSHWMIPVACTNRCGSLALNLANWR